MRYGSQSMGWDFEEVEWWSMKGSVRNKRMCWSRVVGCGGQGVEFG